MSNRKLKAVIWDFDGTLVDTRQKNLNVTRKIVEDITGKNYKNFPPLQNLQNYLLANSKSANWRDIYKHEFNFSEETIDYAGSLWTKFQLEDETNVNLIQGIEEIIILLSEIKQGIVSQNSRENILNILKYNNVAEFFPCIIGYEEVDMTKQKPEPDGLLKCIEELVKDEGIILFIGDHETDTKCAINANKILSMNNDNIEIISVAALYAYEESTTQWSITPDYEAISSSGLINLINKFL